MWNDADMDSLGLNKFGIEIDPETAEIVRGAGRLFLCYLEDWETGCIKKESPQNRKRLLF